jgi:hypothetical protein
MVPSAFCSDFVSALRHLAEMINQRLQLRPFRGAQGFAVEFGAEDLISRAHASVWPAPPT